MIWTGFTVLSVEGICAALGRKPGPDNLEAVTLACYEDGKRFSALDLLNSMAHGNTLSRQVGAFFEKVDVLVTPTIARPPAPLGELDQNRKGMSAIKPDAYRAALHCLVTFDRRDCLGRIRCPTLALAGERDRVAAPAVVERMAQAIPGATYQVIPGVGHLANLERPEAFNAVLEGFLADLPS